MKVTVRWASEHTRGELFMSTHVLMIRNLGSTLLDASKASFLVPCHVLLLFEDIEATGFHQSFSTHRIQGC